MPIIWGIKVIERNVAKKSSQASISLLYVLDAAEVPLALLL